MKIHFRFKCPYAVDRGLVDAGLDLSELDPDIEKLVGKYFEYGEYVDIELDTETGEAKVVPNG